MMVKIIYANTKPKLEVGSVVKLQLYPVEKPCFVMVVKFGTIVSGKTIRYSLVDLETGKQTKDGIFEVDSLDQLPDSLDQLATKLCESWGTVQVVDDVKILFGE